MANRLADERSPYLRQHADNPVDWYPWGEEAFARARAEGKPILLSIGYAACHWCHVMERESFQDPLTAALMNEHFVNIKVDREERPDLDSLYMEAVQALTGRGGWPMTVFLTPDGKPFYGGTYFPPEPRHGLPSFRQVLEAVAEAYAQRPQEVAEIASRMAALLSQGWAMGPVRPLRQVMEEALTRIHGAYDPHHGGFGGAPKFPQAMVLDFLLAFHILRGDPLALRMVEQTLDEMARGGLRDHLGGGFHRYAVDAAWQVPHFEKMLYDNALLAQVYLHAHQVTGKPTYRRIAEETLDFVLREMRSPEGGFYATLDADSEGEEGRFYTWTPDEVERLLGPDLARAFNAYYGLTPQGNFEGRNVLHAPRHPDVVAHRLGLSPEGLEEALVEARARLLAAREARPRPARDEKVLAEWNGFALRALAEAGAALGRADYLQAARASAAFLLDRMVDGEGVLRRTYVDGEARLPGYLADYGAVADGLLALYAADGDLRWFQAAQRLAEAMVDLFWEAGEGFWDTGPHHERLVARPRTLQDNATPSGHSLAVRVLARLALYLGDERLSRIATEAAQAAVAPASQYPLAFGHLLGSLFLLDGQTLEIALVGEPEEASFRALQRVIQERFLPHAVVAAGRPDGPETEAVPLLAGRPPVEGKATVYLCRG
ncbi:MAG: thioredoxin domain-containing protein, partial [Anaerolineae bacterium]